MAHKNGDVDGSRLSYHKKASCSYWKPLERAKSDRVIAYNFLDAGQRPVTNLIATQATMPFMPHRPLTSRAAVRRPLLNSEPVPMARTDSFVLTELLAFKQASCKQRNYRASSTLDHGIPALQRRQAAPVSQRKFVLDIAFFPAASYRRPLERVSLIRQIAQSLRDASSSLDEFPLIIMNLLTGDGLVLSYRRKAWLTSSNETAGTLFEFVIGRRKPAIAFVSKRRIRQDLTNERCKEAQDPSSTESAIE